MPTIDSTPASWPQRLLQHVVYENILIALCAVAMVRVTQIVFYLPTDFSVLDLFVFCATLCVYNVHTGASKLSQPSPAALLAALFARTSPLPTRALVLAAVAGAVISFLFLHRYQQLTAIALGFVTMAYTFPLVRVRRTPTRFREMYLIKVLTIGLVWSFATVLLPVMPFQIPDAPVFLLFVERMLFIIAITVPFEIRDMEQEKNWGNITLPVALGVKRSKYLAVAMLILHDVLVLVHYIFLENLHPPLAAALALSAVPAILLVMLTKEGRHLFFYKFWVDGTMMLQYLFVILLY